MSDRYGRHAGGVSIFHIRDSAELSVMPPDAPHAEGGGDQQNTNSQGAGNGAGVEAVLQKGVGVTSDGIVHGVVDVCTGDQREEGHQKIRGGRAFPNPGHDLGVDGDGGGGEEEGGEVGHPQKSKQPVGQPAEDTACNAQEHAGAVKVQENAYHRSFYHCTMQYCGLMRY